MPNTPVSPGDPLKPRLSDAQWFNSTLKSNHPTTKSPYQLLLPREGEIYCVAEDDVERFDPVGITTLADEDSEYYQRIPYVSKADVDQHNWVVAQEGGPAGSVIRCVVFGLTRANVLTQLATHKSVVYNPTTLALETAKEGKAQILVKGGTSFPSLINIGCQPNLIRVRGTLLSDMPPTANYYTIQNLVGINFFADELSSSITAYNLHEFEADAGADVRAEWVMDLPYPRWEIYQVTCP